MESEELYEKIESYLLHKMSENERADFELELAANDNLMAQFKKQQSDHELLEIVVQYDLREQVNQWKIELQNETISLERNQSSDIKAKKEFQTLAVPAIVLLFIIITSFLIINTSSDPGNIISAPIDNSLTLDQNTLQPVHQDPKESNRDERKEIEPLQGPKKENHPAPPKGNKLIAMANSRNIDLEKYLINVSKRADEDTTLIHGLNLLLQDSLEEGIVILSPLMKKGTQEERVHATFSVALSYLNLGQPDNAIPLLKSSLDPSLLYTLDAEWFLAVSYIRNSNFGKAKKLLIKMSENPNHDYHTEAKIYLKEF